MKNIKSFEDFTKDNNKVMNAILNNDVDFIFNFFKNGIIKYEKENEESFQECRNKGINYFDKINEGLVIDKIKHLIYLDDSNDNEVITDVSKLPVCDKTSIDGVDIYSIFKRGRDKNGNKSFTDGNAFNKAFKEEVWRFADGEKEKIITRIIQVLKKYLLSHRHDICVVVPSTSGFNDTFAQLIHDACGAEIVDKMLVKLTTQEAYELYDEKLDFFHRYYPKIKDRENAIKNFEIYLNRMDEEKNGMFCIHYIDDIEMRNNMEYVLKMDNTYKTILANENKLYEKDVLIIDDLMSRGTSIKNAIKYVKEYSPKSITVLTLMSKN